MENWKDIILIQKWRDGVWQQYVLVLNSMQWLCLIIINTKWAPSKLCHVRHHDWGVKDIPTDKVIIRVINYQLCLLCCTFINWILFYHRQIPIPLVHNCFIFNLRHVNRRQAWENWDLTCHATSLWNLTHIWWLENLKDSILFKGKENLCNNNIYWFLIQCNTHF